MKTELEQKTANEIVKLILSNKHSTDEVKVTSLTSYTIIKFFKTPSIRIKYGRSKQYISLNPLYNKIMSSFPFIKTENVKSDPWVRITIDSEPIPSYLHPLFLQVYDEANLLATVETFSCCSRYVECSNEKHCIHPDRKFSAGCSYREHLINGRIFFGKNRIFFVS